MDRSGQRIDKGDPQVDSADPTLLRISLPRLAPGRYHVTWRVLSVDTLWPRVNSRSMSRRKRTHYLSITQARLL